MTYNPTTAADFVYDAIRRMLMSGELQPFDRLPQRKLAKRFGMSSIPVIEATRRLERDGLLISLPNKGAHVPAWSPEDIEGAFLAREALEGIACRLFVERATDEARAELIQCGNRFKKFSSDGVFMEICEADVALHLHIVRSTGARTLLKAIENHCVFTFTIQNSIALRNHFQHRLDSADLHDELIEALLSGNSEAAETAGKAHVARAREDMIEMMRQCNEERILS